MNPSARRLRSRRWRWLWPHVRPQIGALSVVLLLAAAASSLSIALPLLSREIIDRGLLGRDFPLLLRLCGLIVGLAAASFVMGAAVRWIYVRASARILFSLREQVYAHLLRLSPEFFRARATGDLVTRLDGDVAEVQRFSTDTLLAFVNGLLMLVGTAAIMLTMSWKLSLVAAALLPVQLIVRRASRPWLMRCTRALREQSGAVSHFLFETLSAVKSIQGVAAEGPERERLGTLNREYLNRLLSVQIVSYVVGAVSGLLSHSATAMVFIYGGYRVIEGSLTVGTLVAFIAYMARGTGSALSLLNLYSACQRAAVSLERVEELLAEPAMDPQAAGAGHRTRIEGGGLSLLGVGLGVNARGMPLLENCTLEIPAGAKIVIHGSSGIGKSTLIDALRRFVPLDAGTVRLAGVDIREYDVAVLRRAIEVLGTEPVIFRGTVLDNLRFGNAGASDAVLLEAARRAGFDAIAATLPGGYTALIGTGGQGLSSGQRQRLAIARALVRDPCVLVLDEAMAGLDEDSAARLHEVIDAHFAKCTRIVVTHAPGRVPGADLVFELRDRRLIQAPRALRA